MQSFGTYEIRNLDDVIRLETELTFDQRVSACSIYDVLRQSAERAPQSIALTMLMTGADDETPETVTYGKLLEGVTRAANLFYNLGGPNPGVAYVLPSLIETHVVLWGAETEGYAVPINFLLGAEHIADLVRASGASILVALGPHPALDIWQKAIKVRQLVPNITLVQVSPAGAAVEVGAVGLAQALSEQDKDRLIFGRARSEGDVAAYFHTGGTTGSPKLVAHTHRNQIVSAFGGAVLLGYRSDDVMTLGLPLFHVAGTIVGGLSLLMAGANILILSPSGMRNPTIVRNFWKIVERHRAAVIGGVPTALAALLNVPVDADISSARISVVGASSTPNAVATQFEAHTGTRLHEILGMTETAGLVAIAPSGAEPILGSVGFRLPYTRTEIRKLKADGSLGEACATREIGVLTISGPTVTPGYRNEADSAGALDTGTIVSGDLAYADEEGRIYIAGRAKDVIIRGGHNIDPLMIENVLQAHPAVEAAAAVGQPDRYAGELPVCYVSLRPGKTATPDELKAFAEPLIAERPAWPKHIYVVDSIPVTAVGKIFKPELRRDAARREVNAVVADALGGEGAVIDVAVGGSRGMDVRVGLPARHQPMRAKVEAALQGYTFNFVISDPS